MRKNIRAEETIDSPMILPMPTSVILLKIGCRTKNSIGVREAAISAVTRKLANVVFTGEYLSVTFFESTMYRANDKTAQATKRFPKGVPKVRIPVSPID